MGIGQDRGMTRIGDPYLTRIAMAWTDTSTANAFIAMLLLASTGLGQMKSITMTP